MIRAEIDGELGERLASLYEESVAEQRAYASLYEALPEDKRRERPVPTLETFDQFLQRTLEEGLADRIPQRPPNSVLVVPPAQAYRRDAKPTPLDIASALPYHIGDMVVLRATLPIGAEIVSLEADVTEAKDWSVSNFYIGRWDLLAHGYGRSVPMSRLTRLTRADLLCVFANRRMLHQLIVEIVVRCERDGATLNGYTAKLWSDEQAFAAQPYLEPRMCRHPESRVVRRRFADMGEVLRPMLRDSTYAMSVPIAPYECLDCGQRLFEIDSEKAKP